MVTQPETMDGAPDQPNALEPAAGVHDGLQPIRLPNDWALTDERFLEIAHLNDDLMLERTTDGRLVQMAFPERISERVATAMCALIGLWALQTRGEIRGEAGGYIFSGGPAMCPDVSWVSPEQLRQGRIERGQFYFAPAFAVEVRSLSQSIISQQRRMQQWMEHGVQLGWLVDPHSETVWIYRADSSVEELKRPPELSGEDVCSGLVIDMSQVWE
jgi:Uma2 family endonuclease